MLVRQMFNMGATAYLTKPVRWEELWEVINKHVTFPELTQVQSAVDSSWFDRKPVRAGDGCVLVCV